MASITAQLPRLDSALLSSDEDEYDRIATESVQQLLKATETDLGSIEDLDPATQTIAFLFALSNQIDISLKSGKAQGRQLPASVLPEGRLWPYINTILINFDPIQVRYVGHLLVKVTELVASVAEQTQDYALPIRLLETTILRLDPTSASLTSTHHAYIRICLLAGEYAQALQILELPIYYIPSSESSRGFGNRAYRYLCSAHETSASYITVSNHLTQKITSRLYLEYFLYGAMCFMGIGLFEKALVFLEIVLTAPTSQNAASVVQLEAFKKWILINLLVHGTPGQYPKSLTQSTLLRNLRAAAKPYECIADAFKSGRVDRIKGEIQEGLQIWQDDENYGLIHEVFAAFRKFAILGLGKTYAALPITEVSRLTSSNPEDADGMVNYVTALIEAGQLQAELTLSEDGKNSILRFANEQTASIPESMVEKEMVVRTQELQQLLQNINNIDHQTATRKEYIEYLQKLRQARDRAKKSDASANRGIGDDIHDEDMMDDL